MRIRLTALALLIFALSVFLSETPAPALAGGPTMVVDTIADDNMAFNGNCTLREAVAAARTNNPVDACPAGHPGGEDVIQLQAGQTYDLGGNGELLIFGGPVIIEALGGGNAVIDADDQHRVMGIQGETTVTLNDITIANGNSDDSSGGGIFSDNGNLTLNRVQVIGNRSGPGSTSGGILNAGGVLRVSDSLFMGNQAGASGGGLSNTGSAMIVDTAFIGNTASSGAGVSNNNELTISRSLIAGNTATELGGGIRNTDAFLGEVTLENVTIDGNEGGAIRMAGGMLNATNVTISDNTDEVGPLGILVFAGDVVLQNTILANGDGSINCTGDPVISLGNNLENGDTCGLGQPGDQINTDPLLGTLQDNGGPTDTRALPEGSPAIDRADNAACPDVDQRGEDRPQGGGCDIGAFESPFTAPTPSPTPSPSPSPSPTPAGQDVVWADHNCSDAADSVDALLGLRFDASLPTDTDECPDLGDPVDVQDFAVHPWGDIDCSGEVDAVDSLKILRYDAGLSSNPQSDCPEPGEQVIISGA